MGASQVGRVCVDPACVALVEICVTEERRVPTPEPTVREGREVLEPRDRCRQGKGSGQE